jgi:hypothetical protein
MPHLNPFWYTTLTSWTFAILTFLIWFHQTIAFPNILSLQLTRMILLCQSFINH